MVSVLRSRDAFASRATERPDVLAALAGFSLGISAFTGIHLGVFLTRAFEGGLSGAERGWAALGAGLVAAGVVNALLIHRVLTTPRVPGAPPVP